MALLECWVQTQAQEMAGPGEGRLQARAQTFQHAPMEATLLPAAAIAAAAQWIEYTPRRAE